jgi:hypothetical protein
MSKTSRGNLRATFCQPQIPPRASGSQARRKRAPAKLRRNTLRGLILGLLLRQIMTASPCQRSQARALRRLGQILREVPARSFSNYGIGHRCDLEMLPLNCGSSPGGFVAWCGVKALAVALRRPTGKKSITTTNDRYIRRQRMRHLVPCLRGTFLV